MMVEPLRPTASASRVNRTWDDGVVPVELPNGENPGGVAAGWDASYIFFGMMSFLFGKAEQRPIGNWW